MPDLLEFLDAAIQERVVKRNALDREIDILRQGYATLADIKKPEIPALPPEGNLSSTKPLEKIIEKKLEVQEKQQRRAWGTGHIKRKPNSRFWWIGYRKDGKSFEESSKSEDYGEAEKILNARLGIKQPSLLSPASNTTFDKKNGKDDVPVAHDPKCRRCPALHTKSQHVGPSGKCIACWCGGFVGLEEFATAR